MEQPLTRSSSICGGAWDTGECIYGSPMKSTGSLFRPITSAVTEGAREWVRMRLGIALDCTKATGKGACAYFESIGLPPTEIVAVGSDCLSPSACLTLLYDCRDGGYIFCGKRREDIGYDSFLRYGGERADRRLVCKRSAPYAVRQRRAVMCAYLRRSGCDIVCIVANDDRSTINEQAREKTIALPYGLRENDVIRFLQAAEQTLLPKILLQ